MPSFAHFLPVGGNPAAYPTVDGSPETTRRFLAEAFGGDSDAAAECYFAQLKRIADEPRAQIVGHFDLLTKFDEKEHFFDETSLRYRAAALDAMDALVSAGKIFEVNTGAISRGWRTTPYPSRWVLEQLKRRNAQVTISSDSHGVGTVDCAFNRQKPCLKPVGLRKSGCLTERRLRHRKLNKQSPGRFGCVPTAGLIWYTGKKFEYVCRTFAFFRLGRKHRRG